MTGLTFRIALPDEKASYLAAHCRQRECDA